MAKEVHLSMCRECDRLHPH
nr:unnamed protein product [Callosobruchus chinensis]